MDLAAIEMGATLPGVPLYAAVGYQAIERIDTALPDGEVLEIVRMAKNHYNKRHLRLTKFLKLRKFYPNSPFETGGLGIECKAILFPSLSIQKTATYTHAQARNLCFRDNDRTPCGFDLIQHQLNIGVTISDKTYRSAIGRLVCKNRAHNSNCPADIHRVFNRKNPHF